SGISHDAVGNIYVADAGNNRVQVFSPTLPRPSGDTAAPVAAILSPVKNQVFPAQSPALVQGTAGDAVGVASTEVAIRDVASGLWWNANDAVWQPLRAFNTAPWSGVNGTSVTYTSSFIAIE